MKHTRNIAYETFNRKENLWGDARTHPQLKYCSTTDGSAKFNCSVDEIKTANQVLHLSSKFVTENGQPVEKLVLEFFDIDKTDGSYKKQE